MLSFFPQPLPDEHVFSLVARYHRLSANRNATDTRKQLGVSKGAIKAQNIFNATFHSALPAVASQVGSDTLTLANNHSLYPLFKLSIPSPLTGIWIKAWRDGNISPPFTDRWMNDRVLAFDKSWRFCKSCITKDREKYGVSYWHVSHQIPTLELCPIHHEKLIGLCEFCGAGHSTLNELQLPNVMCDQR